MITLRYNGVYFYDIKSGTGSHHYLFIQFSIFFLITRSCFIFIKEYTSYKIENNEQYSDEKTPTKHKATFLFFRIKTFLN